jgi:hypothetical protein
VAIAILASGCGDDPSGFAGDYETVSTSVQSDGCGGVGTPEMVPDSLHWFRLGDVETDTGMLVGYFQCFDAESCSEMYDLYRSFGGGDDGGWLTTVSTAIDPGCTLQYRERILSRVDDMTIEIDDVLYQEVDPSLSGEACAIAEAKRRGTTMPCVKQTVYLADEH